MSGELDSIMTPSVSVVMAAYNSGEFIGQAIQSVLDQTHKDFEFIIVDDGSTDNTLEVIRQFHDPRIRLIVNETNLGIVGSVNHGIDISRGEFIARMDSDDVCLPQRLEKEIEYLHAHPEIGVLGTEVREILNTGEIITRSRHILTDPYLIKFWLLTDTVINNPTAVIRKELLVQVNGYDPEYIYAQDYEIWTRLAKITKITVLPEPLVNWRKHGGNITIAKWKKQSDLHNRVVKREVKSLTGLEFSDEVLNGILSSDILSPDLTRQAVKLFRTCLQEYERNNEATGPKRKELRDRLNWRIYRILQRTRPRIQVLDELIKVNVMNRDILVSKIRSLFK